MHRPFLPAALLAAVIVAAPAFAQMSGHDHGAMTAKPAAAANAKPAEGEVRKVDRAKGTVTLKHGPIESIAMPPMTMVFTAKDPKLLANVKEGDKVRFVAEQGKDGQLIVTSLDVVR